MRMITLDARGAMVAPRRTWSGSPLPSRPKAPAVPEAPERARSTWKDLTWLALFALLLLPALPAASWAAPASLNAAARITVVYDNVPHAPGMRTAWGFAAVVDTGEERVLFDTGGDGEILLHNMARLGIAPESIDAVMLSHIHVCGELAPPARFGSSPSAPRSRLVSAFRADRFGSSARMKACGYETQRIPITPSSISPNSFASWPRSLRRCSPGSAATSSKAAPRAAGCGTSGSMGAAGSRPSRLVK